MIKFTIFQFWLSFIKNLLIKKYFKLDKKHRIFIMLKERVSLKEANIILF